MSELTHAIRRIANPERRTTGMPGFVAKTLSTAAVTGLAALVLVPAPGHALALGEITVRSALGQPLRATVPVRTAPGEVLGGDCIRVGSALSGSGLVPLSQARVLVTGEGRSGNVRELVITTPRPLYEPMYELALQVSCPGTPGMVRQYVLMLDLPAVLESAAPVAPPSVAPMASTSAALPRRQPAAATTPATPTAAPRAPVAPIAEGVRYRVQPGDTLSSIAARVQGRAVGIWTMVEQIHAANPGVFPDGNLDRLPAGVELLIPGEGVAAAPTLDPAPGLAAAPPAPAPVPAPAGDPVVTALPETAVATATASPAEILAVEPVPAVAEPVAEVALDAPLPPAPAPVRTAAPVAETPAVETAPAGADAGSSGWSPLAAMAAGAGFGILISLLLWSRRLGARLRPATATSRPVRTGAAKAATAATAVAAAPVMARVAPPAEPAISVSYDDLDEPLARSFGQAARSSTAPAPAPMDDITADLEQLFLDDDGRAPVAADGDEPELEITSGDTQEQPVTGGFEVSEPTGDFPSMTLESPTALAPADLDPLELGIDLDDELTRLGDAAPIDVGFSDPADLELDQPTVQRPMRDRDETPVRSGGDVPGATTTGEQGRKPSLLDAMDLPERDYEEEMTASQLLDPELVQAALEGGPDTDRSGIRRRR